MAQLLAALLEGLVFGMIIALIPGPIFFLIIQRTLREGRLIGFLCGLGAVQADAVYAIMSAIGLTAVSHYLLTYQSLITLMGGFFILFLGTKTFSRHIAMPVTQSNKNGFINAWLSTFALTMTNPVTILSYTAIFAGLGIGEDDFLTAVIFVVGVILGALCIVVLLVSFLHYFRSKLSPQAFTMINKIAGITLIGFGVAAIVRALLIILRNHTWM